MNQLESYAARFDQFWAIDKEVPSGKIERSKATQVVGNSWLSKGKEQPRLCLDGLNDEKYKIAARIDSCPIGYERVKVKIGNVVKDVFVNIRSVLKRLSPPDDVQGYEDGTISFADGLRSDSFDHYFQLMVRLAREQELLKDPEARNGLVVGDESGKALEPIGKPFASLKSIPEMVQLAKERNCSFRLTTDRYPVDMDIHPDDFVAMDTDGVHIFQYQRGVSETLSVTRGGKRIVRRAESFLELDREKILRRMKIYTDLGGVGVMTPLSMGFCLSSDRYEDPTFVLYHEIYHGEFSDIHDYLPGKNALFDVTHNLLQGLARIAKFGSLGNLTPRGIRIRKDVLTIRAEIYDLSQFKYDEEREKDVLDMGKILNNLFLSYVMIHRMEFPSMIEALVEGMQILDPKSRWTAEQCLKFFEASLVASTEEEKKTDE